MSGTITEALRQAYQKTQAALSFLLQSLQLLGRSILGTFRRTTTPPCKLELAPLKLAVVEVHKRKDRMVLINGYWDPCTLTFIEDESGPDPLELCILGSSHSGDGRARRASRGAGASAAASRTAGASGSKKTS